MTSAARNVSTPSAKGETATGPDSTVGLLVQSGAASLESHPAWSVISSLPTLLAVAIPLRELRVRDLIALCPGQIVTTAWNLTDDMPLATGPIQLAWGELDVLNGNIALRITRLA